MMFDLQLLLTYIHISKNFAINLIHLILTITISIPLTAKPLAPPALQLLAANFLSGPVYWDPILFQRVLYGIHWSSNIFS